MRYEHIVLDLSTAACATLHEILKPQAVLCSAVFGQFPSPVAQELMNLFNELEARLQRRDQDPQYDGSDLT